MAGIGVLSTAHGLLGDAERVQAGQAHGEAALEQEALVVADGSET